jgi:hypothetical protein
VCDTGDQSDFNTLFAEDWNERVDDEGANEFLEDVWSREAHTSGYVVPFHEDFLRGDSPDFHEHLHENNDGQWNVLSI